MTTNHHDPITAAKIIQAVINTPLQALDSAITNIRSGVLSLTSPNIDGGTIDGATIGGATPGAVTASNFAITGTLDIGGTFHAHRNGTDQTLATATATVIQLNTATYDSNSRFNTTSYYYVPAAGTWLFYGAIRFKTAVDAAAMDCFILLNSSTNLAFNTVEASGTAAHSVWGISFPRTYNGTTDYVQLVGKQSSGGNIDVDGTSAATFMTGWRVD